MKYNSIINNILDEPFSFDEAFYYHAFLYNQTEFINMITKGIKSAILLGKNAQGNNGYYYVSLSKKEECEFSAYNRLEHLPMFILSSKIKTIKTRNFKRYNHYLSFAMELPLPFRESEYDDEYQKFLKVSPKDILAIQYNMYISDIEDRLLLLKSMIQDLNSKKIYLPIVDGVTSRIINQEKVLLLKK